MKNRHPRKLAHAAAIALALCLLSACEKAPQERAPALTKLSDFSSGGKKKDPKLDKNMDKSMEDVRNDALDQINKQLKNQEEATKKSLANKEKDAKRREKEAKEKKEDPRAPKTFATGSAPITEIDPSKRNKHPDKAIPIPDNTSNPHFSEILGPGQKSPTSTGNTVNINNRGQKSGQKAGSNDEADLKVMNAQGSAEFDNQTAGQKQKDPNFLQRLFGKKKPEAPLVKETANGSQVEIVNQDMKKKKLGQVYGEKPDGTQMGSKSTGSVLADETGKTTLKEIYNPTNAHSVPNLENFKHSPAEKSDLYSDRQRNEMIRARLESEATNKKQFGDGKPSGDKAARPRPITDFEEAPKARSASEKSAPAGDTSTQNVSKPPVARNAPAALMTEETAPITANSAINALETGAAAAATAKVGSTQIEPAASKEGSVVDTSVKKHSTTDEASYDIQNELGTMEEYRRGLNSRDVVAREASFQRAVLEKREDALHALSEEVRSSGLLAPRAARFLAAIGKVNDEVERALMTGLNSNSAKDNQLREFCADSLGQLRIRRAVPLLIEKVKNDKSLQVRSASAAALGMIGERSAVATLRMKLEDRGEIEFVKQSASLALARLGDGAGREHLLQSLQSQNPAYQILGMTGLAQLHDPDSAAYLASLLDSQYSEVWTTAVALFPRLGARKAIPILRDHLLSYNEVSRTRAALALGFLGNTDGLPLICRAARSGELQERAMACDLLGRLHRTEQIPLLIEKLSDPHTNVRQTAACALAQMDAKAAIPYLSESARGRVQNSQLPPSLRGGQQDIYERAIMLASLRILRGEKDDLSIELPRPGDSRWPEFDKELLKQQQDMIKMYQLVEVVPSGKGTPGALVQVPGGQEVMYRKGETVAAGFKIVEVSAGAVSPDGKGKIPAFVTLMRGEERIILYQGKPAEIDNVRELK